jgi:hypothetical protein
MNKKRRNPPLFPVDKSPVELLHLALENFFRERRRFSLPVQIADRINQQAGRLARRYRLGIREARGLAMSLMTLEFHRAEGGGQ